MTTVRGTLNPYVGPRAFRLGEPLYGRDREVLELLGLLLAERIVLLHSPSGAGKTSLIQAALIGRLEQEGFEVLPVIRINGDPPPGIEHLAEHNRYVLSALMSLEHGVPEKEQRSGADLAGMSLHRYLSERPARADNRVLIIDQFEEVLLDPANESAKKEFFTQLGSALRHRERWALLLARDDYVAALDSYLKAIPTRARTRFRLNFLSQQAARQAVQCPAEVAGVPFSAGAVDKLIDDLRQIWVRQPDGTSEPRTGPYVEPVQLQVVCLRLWNRLRRDQQEIRESDITSGGDVDMALAMYYAQQVADIADRSGLSERSIRDWFDQQLIVERRFRGQAHDGPRDSAPASRDVLRLLEDAHLIRAEQRLGTTWYELAHDRLVTPVQDDNTRWRNEHLHALQRQAAIWDDEDRPEGLLLGLRELAEGETWAEEYPDELTKLDREFLDACRRARARTRRKRLYQRFLVAVTVVAMVLAGTTVSFWFEAKRQASASAVAERTANAAGQVSKALAYLNADPHRSIHEALGALDRSPDGMTPDIRDGLYQAVDQSRLRTTLRSPETAGAAGVNDMALSPDGKNLVAGYSGRAQMWDLSNRTVRFELPVRGPVEVAYGDRNRVATTNGLSTQIWDASSGAAIATIDNGSQVSDLAFDPRAERLATVDTEGTARVWDVDRQTLVTRFLVSGQPQTVTFDRDGLHLATGDTDGTATIWEPTTGNRLQDFRGHDGAIQTVAFSPDGSLLATASQDSTARIWNAGTGQSTATLSGHTNSVFWAGFTPDGERVATTSADGTAKIWDARSGAPLLTLTGHTNPISAAAFAPAGATLFSASWDGTIKVWDATTPHSSSVAGLAFRPGSPDVLATGSADTTAKLWDIPAALGPSCTSEAPGTGVGSTVRHTLHGAGGIGAVAFSPDGALLATTSADRTVQLWNVESGQTVRTLVGHSANVNGMSWHPEGKVLATAAADGVIVWDIPSGGAVRRLVATPQNELYSVAFDPDGTQVATGDGFGTITSWDVASGEITSAFTPHSGAVFKVAFSPERGSGVLATASLDRTASLWNARNEEIARFDHGNTVRDLAFSPDGRRLATASWDRMVTVRDVDVESGRPPLTISHAAQVNNVAFSPDGQRLASSTSDHGVHVYELDEQNLLALARCRAAAG